MLPDGGYGLLLHVLCNCGRVVARIVIGVHTVTDVQKLQSRLRIQRVSASVFIDADPELVRVEIHDRLRVCLQFALAQLADAGPSVHIPQETEAGVLGGKAFPKHAFLIKIDVDARRDFFSEAVQYLDQANQHAVAFVPVPVASVIRNDHVLDQLVVGKQLAVAVVDLAAGRRKDHRPLRDLLHVLLCGRALDDLQRVHPADQYAEKHNKNKRHRK